jgi:GNAT superfamily N-acetyltransferase
MAGCVRQAYYMGIHKLAVAQAIASSWQGRGLGMGLLKDAMQRTLQAAEIAGIRAFSVHARDDDARAFYEHFGSTPLPSDPYHLYRLLKDIRAGVKYAPLRRLA